MSEGKFLAIFSGVIRVDFMEEVMLPHLCKPPFPYV